MNYCSEKKTFEEKKHETEYLLNKFQKIDSKEETIHQKNYTLKTKTGNKKCSISYNKTKLK